jgi:hypothetical protein
LHIIDCLGRPFRRLPLFVPFLGIVVVPGSASLADSRSRFCFQPVKLFAVCVLNEQPITAYLKEHAFAALKLPLESLRGHSRSFSKDVPGF